jgi:hypothetical protein
MKWTPQQIQALRKKVYGNFGDEELLKKVSELNLHLENYDKSFLSLNTKHEWAEVERIADQLNEMIQIASSPRVSSGRGR